MAARDPGEAAGDQGHPAGIRPAERRDLAAILEMIRELADYEHLAHAVVFDPTEMERHLFGPRPYAEVLVSEAILPGSVNSSCVGFALFFHSFSTFVGKPGIYLEDLYVRPSARRQGHGRRLLRAVAGLARARGCGRLEWSVLDWNQPAIDFYHALGAIALDDWTMFRLSAHALNACAGDC
jgi:GNAT superfamily N-acetyltransferase